jgi:hypothetical protein
MSRSSLALLAAAALILGGCQGQTLDSTENPPPSAGSSQPAPQAAPAPATAPAPRPAAAPAPAPEPAHPAPLMVPDGVIIDLELQKNLNSGRNQVGDKFKAMVTEAVMVDGVEAIPVGSLVKGTVEDVKAAKRGAGRATMTLRFERLVLPSGYSTAIQASFSDETGGKKKRNAAIIGGSAAGGAILGKVLGDDNKDAAVGALVGAAIGTGVVMSKEGVQVDLPKGTPFSVVLDEFLQVPGETPLS